MTEHEHNCFPVKQKRWKGKSTITADDILDLLDIVKTIEELKKLDPDSWNY